MKGRNLIFFRIESIDLRFLVSTIQFGNVTLNVIQANYTSDFISPSSSYSQRYSRLLFYFIVLLLPLLFFINN